MNTSFKATYIGVKLRQLKHIVTFRSKNPRMKSAIKRYKAYNDKKTKSQIKTEVDICKRFWGIYPLHYFRYDLYKKNVQLTKFDLINYIPEFFFYNIYLPYYDGDKYSILLMNKNISEQLFRSVDISQPRTICKLIKGEIHTRDLKKMDFHAINLELKRNMCEKIFVKPVHGEGGYGIMVFHLRENQKYINNNNVELTETFLFNISKVNDYIIQEGIIQDESITKIYPSSVNTFRIATENIRGCVRVVCSVLRMGRQGNEVDNASQNGLVLGINSNTGEFNDYAIDEMGGIFYKHPDTNFIFKRHMISDWNKIVNFTLECAKKLPEFTHLGWDIALTKKGPMAIETNLEFGLDLYQLALGGLREAFNITDPNKYLKR
jgi:hypothetical protein